MNTRKKGTDFQRWCQKWLEKQGYIVHNQPVASKPIFFKDGTQRWVSVRNDIFGCDLIAMKAPDELRFIQCTEHTGVEKRLATFCCYPWPLIQCTVELWMKMRGRRGVVVIRRFTGTELVLWGEIERRRLKIYV